MIDYILNGIRMRTVTVVSEIKEGMVFALEDLLPGNRRIFGSQN